MQHTRRREKRVEEETEGRRRGAAAAAVLDEDQWQRIEKASDGAKVLSRPTKEFPVDKEKTNSTGSSSSSSNCRG